MNKNPDEKKKEDRADESKVLSDSELEQVSGGLPDWLKAGPDPETREHLI